MKLSKRLEAIAHCVPLNTNVTADIGTDHGYIPIYLIENKISNKVIACDINPNPLKGARANIKTKGFSNKIETRLGNGLDKLEKSEVDVILIAGMGGLLIRNILKQGHELVKDVGLLILQPQSNMDILRMYLHTIDFKIINEKLIEESGRFYTIIVAEKGKEAPYSVKEYLYGRKILANNNEVLNKYLLHRIEYLEDMKETLLKVDNLEATNRLECIIKEIIICKEILKCQ